MSVGPKPSKVIEVRHIKKIKLILRKLRITVNSKKLTVTLELDTDLTLKSWKAAFTKLNCPITQDPPDDGDDSSGGHSYPPPHSSFP